jgi:hypothetical protein
MEQSFEHDKIPKKNTAQTTGIGLPVPSSDIGIQQQGRYCFVFAGVSSIPAQNMVHRIHMAGNWRTDHCFALFFQCCTAPTGI